MSLCCVAVWVGVCVCACCLCEGSCIFVKHENIVDKISHVLRACMRVCVCVCMPCKVGVVLEAGLATVCT